MLMPSAFPPDEVAATPLLPVMHPAGQPVEPRSWVCHWSSELVFRLSERADLAGYRWEIIPATHKSAPVAYGHHHDRSHAVGQLTYFARQITGNYELELAVYDHGIDPFDLVADPPAGPARPIGRWDLEVQEYHRRQVYADGIPVLPDLSLPPLTPFSAYRCHLCGVAARTGDPVTTTPEGDTWSECAAGSPAERCRRRRAEMFGLPIGDRTVLARKLLGADIIADPTVPPGTFRLEPGSDVDVDPERLARAVRILGEMQAMTRERLLANARADNAVIAKDRHYDAAEGPTEDDLTGMHDVVTTLEHELGPRPAAVLDLEQEPILAPPTSFAASRARTERDVWQSIRPAVATLFALADRENDPLRWAILDGELARIDEAIHGLDRILLARLAYLESGGPA